jgi:hypothetical protein
LARHAGGCGTWSQSGSSRAGLLGSEAIDAPTPAWTRMLTICVFQRYATRSGYRYLHAGNYNALGTARVARAETAELTTAGLQPQKGAIRCAANGQALTGALKHLSYCYELQPGPTNGKEGDCDRPSLCPAHRHHTPHATTEHAGRAQGAFPAAAGGVTILCKHTRPEVRAHGGLRAAGPTFQALHSRRRRILTAISPRAVSTTAAASQVPQRHPQHP